MAKRQLSLTRYNRAVSQIQNGLTNDADPVVANFGAIETTTDVTQPPVEDHEQSFAGIERQSFIVQFNDSLVSTGSNTIIIDAGATVLHEVDSITGIITERTGWANSGSIDVTGLETGVIWAIYPALTYSATNDLPSSKPAGGYRVLAFTNSGGTVTVSKKSWQNCIESQPVRLEEDLTLNGDLIVNSETALYALPINFHDCEINYIDAKSVEVLQDSAVRDDSNTADIIFTTDTTLDLTATGTGGLLQSDNLTGTITITTNTSVSGSGTAFIIDFVVGDTIKSVGGQCRRITVITSNTAMTVESAWSSGETGVTYKRGGEAPSTHYYLYAIKDTAEKTVSLVGSSRNVAGGQTLVDLPTGYTKKRQLEFEIRNDASGNILNFLFDNNRREVEYYLSESASPYLVLSNSGGNTNWNTVSLATLIPPTAKHAKLGVLLSGDSQVVSRVTYLRPTGSGITTGRYVCAISSAYGADANEVYIPVGTNQSVDYRNQSAGNQGTSIYIMGYKR